MGGRNLIIILVAVALGLLAVFLANSYFSGVEEKNQRIAEENQLTPIVVATQPLDFGSPLTTENIRMQNYPATSVPEGAFLSVEDAMKGGRVVLRPIVPNEPILASKVSGTDGRAVLAANLPEGMRAYTIPVNSLESVAGFVRPGDTVDVMLTRQIPGEGAQGDDLMSEILLERVQVLAIDQQASEQATQPGVGAVATVLVTLREAQELSLARRLGTLGLVLRNVEDLDEANTGTVTNRNVGDQRFRIGPRRTQSAAPAAPAAPVQRVVSVQPAPSGAGQEVRWMGPTMTVYRGTDSTVHGVGPLGGR